MIYNLFERNFDDSNRDDDHDDDDEPDTGPTLSNHEQFVNPII